MPVRKRRRFIPPSAATAHGLEDAYSTSNNFEEMLLLSTCASGPLPNDTSNNSNKLQVISNKEYLKQSANMQEYVRII